MINMKINESEETKQSIDYEALGARGNDHFTPEEMYVAYKGAYEAACDAWGSERIAKEYPTVDEMNGVTGMKNSVDAAIATYSNFADFNGWNDKGKELQFNGYQEAMLYTEAGRSVHDQWVFDNFDKKYRDSERADRRWQFGSFDTIGYDETAKDLVFIKPALEVKGVKFDEDLVHRSYDASVAKYVENHPTQESRDAFEIDHIKLLSESSSFDKMMGRDEFLRALAKSPGAANSGNERSKELPSNVCTDKEDVKIESFRDRMFGKIEATSQNANVGEMQPMEALGPVID